MIYLKMPDGKGYDVERHPSGVLCGFSNGKPEGPVTSLNRNVIRWGQPYVRYDGINYSVAKPYPTF